MVFVSSVELYLEQFTIRRIAVPQIFHTLRPIVKAFVRSRARFSIP